MYKRTRFAETAPVTNRKTIATHDGTFHCDDALACYLLKQLPKFRNAEIVRSRDYITIHKADARVDVGGVYDPERWSFDHHQPTFKVTMAELRPELKNADIKLSSAGLVFHHFGQIIIGAQMKKDPEDPDVKNVFRMVYENFIREIDGIDNGINTSDGDIRYSITTGVSSRVKHLNARWNETLIGDDMSHRFRKAMNLVGKEFRGRVDYYEKSWIPARELVLQAIATRYEVNETGQIIVLDKGGCPWTGHLYDIEEDQNIKGEIKYVIFEDMTHLYRVQAVAIKDGSFSLRLPLPWKGRRDEQLSRETNIPGCVFVHSTGFIGGNKTKEGAIQMAIKALEIHNRI
ncbi:UPF0160 protein MYG1 [Tropilaelaps mercedesae]|uniref:UPF0160 protein MYG1 n=1 Tax=Tropilaelaps mercedesae TaxID=418985 RepID=A0A1V9XFL8_9ACAR|nr:UPF0160 protein MYG1 [Tropilaelaps mercedesae]